jgi:hypothetical protein
MGLFGEVKKERGIPMANTYYEGTGTLVLKQSTPVIEAIFGAFDLDPTFPKSGEAYIANIAENSNISWDAIAERLEGLAAKLKLDLPEVDVTDDSQSRMFRVLEVLAKHFGAQELPRIQEILEQVRLNDFDADLESLFDIARAFDDGHGLYGIKFEACWRCSQPRLFEFGGNGEFYGRHAVVHGNSSQVVALGEELDAALEAKNLEAAAQRVATHVKNLIAGVRDPRVRGELQAKLANELLAAA